MNKLFEYIVSGIFDIAFVLIGHLPLKAGSVHDAKKWLKDIGYTFPQLWNSLPPLMADSKMPLSIIIPVYNSEKYLRGCLMSILNQQTKYEYEVICINDGSKDNSLAILEDIEKQFPNKLRVYNQDNHGISATRNRGISLATGEYIGFIDNDDTVSPYYVEKIISRAYETGADFIQIAYRNVTPRDEVLGEISHGDLVFDTSDTAMTLKEAQGYIWGGAIRRSIFEKLRFPVGFWYEDMINRLVVIRMARRIATIGEPLYFYLVHDMNASRTLWRSNGVKSVDQVWLARQLSEYSIYELKRPVDGVLYTQLLLEYSLMLMFRMRMMDKKTRKAAFVIAADYMKSLNYEYSGMDKYLRRSEKALKCNNYYAWLLNVKAQYLSEK